LKPHMGIEEHMEMTENQHLITIMMIMADISHIHMTKTVVTTMIGLTVREVIFMLSGGKPY